MRAGSSEALCPSSQHKCFTFRGIQEWNSLPLVLRTLKLSVAFRKSFRLACLIDNDTFLKTLAWFALCIWTVVLCPVDTQSSKI